MLMSAVPKCPSLATTTGAPETVTPLIPAMYVALCTLGWPIRMVLNSPSTSLETNVFGSTLPMSILLLPPMLILAPAPEPNAVLKLPLLTLPLSALQPMAVLKLPFGSCESASKNHRGIAVAFGEMRLRSAS